MEDSRRTYAEQLRDPLGQELRGVVSASKFALRGVGHVDRTGLDHDRQAAQVGADDADEGQQPLG